MITAPIVGMVELAVVTALALWAALKRATAMSLCLIAYIPGMEISLRQNHVPVPYLAAPYLLILISVLAVFTVFNHLTKPGRTALLYLALAGSVLTFACYLTLQDRLGPGPAGTIGVMTPLLALVVSLGMEGYRPELVTLVGAALAVAGNVAMLRPAPTVTPAVAAVE